MGCITLLRSGGGPCFGILEKSWKKQFEQSSADKIFIDILLPIEVFVGIALNVVAVCIWLLGPKSRGLCCAVYFAALAGIDLLTLSIPGILKYLYRSELLTTEVADDNKNNPELKSICLVKQSTLPPFLLCSNWITVTLTLERALTVLFPFMFQSQNMRKRSRYIVIAIFIVFVSTYASVTFIQFDDSAALYQDLDTFLSYCFYYKQRSDTMLILELCVRVIIPFVLIITFNVATVVSLCKNKMQSNSANQRAHVQVFTKLTVLTGISFTIANSADAVFAVTRIFSLPVVKFVLNHREEFLYLNNVMNPIICFLVCKSARDDMKTFLLKIATRLRCTRLCRRSQQGASIATVETRTGHRSNNGHDIGVRTKTESKVANVGGFNRENKETDTGAGMTEGSDTEDKSNQGSDKGATTNEGSKAGSKSNQGSDKGSTEGSDGDMSKNMIKVLARGKHLTQAPEPRPIQTQALKQVKYPTLALTNV